MKPRERRQPDIVLNPEPFASRESPPISRSGEMPISEGRTEAHDPACGNQSADKRLDHRKCAALTAAPELGSGVQSSRLPRAKAQTRKWSRGARPHRGRLAK
jgi:hypothetical protein